jgi:hypothetical protein
MQRSDRLVKIVWMENKDDLTGKVARLPNGELSQD